MGWVKVRSPGWRDYAAAFERADEGMIRRAAHKAAEEHVATPVRQAILENPVLNGAIPKTTDFTSVIPEVDTFEDDQNVYVGIPSGNPASDLAHKMEYGSEEEGLSPNWILTGTYDFARPDADRAFQVHLRREMEA